MSFSYSPDLSVPLNYLRWRLNDTVEEYHRYEDEELNYFINQIEPQPPTQKALNKVALKLLKKELVELMMGPSRERSGAYEVYGASADALKAAIDEIEDEIREGALAVPSFGGVYRADVCRTRNNPAYTDNRFYDGVIYCECGCGREKGSHPLV